jgi:D-alanine-D-alanine ligase
MPKLNICLLFGGKSGEHEISLLSAKSIYEALDKEKYNVKLVGIDKQGVWHLNDSANYLLNPHDPSKVALNMGNAQKVIATTSDSKSELVEADSGKSIDSIDVFFPVMHGTYGEDGSMQGFLELLNVAYVGAGVLGSAVGMDKDVMKRLLQQAGIPVADFIALKKYEITEDTLNAVVKKFAYPIFVKPANLGSSVGISKVSDESALKEAIEKAFLYDTKILLEKSIQGRELECSVLGNDNPKASIPGEVIPTKDFYSYEAKYLDENGAVLNIPAKLDNETIKRVQEMAVKTFKVLSCLGMARVDFFLTKNNNLYVNEINTIPGFTKISMYPKLWEISGFSYSKLLDKLIELAIDKQKEKDQLKRNFT